MRFLGVIILLISFGLGACGLHKMMAHAHTQAEQASSAQTYQQNSHSEHAASCCKKDIEEKKAQKPRCLGDVCMNTFVVYENTFDKTDRFAMAMDQAISSTHLKRFLRPPIA